MSQLKIGDKVRCINILGQTGLTLNKKYIVSKIDRENGLISVKYEDGVICTSWQKTFAPSRFVRVDCLKNKIRKLKKLIEK